MAERFPPLSKSAIWRHGKYCLKHSFQETKKAGQIKRVIEVYDEMTEQFQFAKEIRLAAEEYLSDPRDPSKISLAARADEVDVIYFEIERRDDGEIKKVRKVATAQELLLRLKEVNPDLMIDAFRAPRKIDIRKYALDVIATVDVVLDKFARIEGVYTKERDNSQTIENALKGLTLYREKNPDATEEELREAIAIFARGVSIAESVLIEKLGVVFTSETVQ
jgi:hypothetical protein